MLWMAWVAVAALFAAAAVAAGAFGAHALEGRLAVDDLRIFETAVRYQMYHVCALLAVGFCSSRLDHWFIKLAGALFVVGICVFSGSLYLLIATGYRWLGAITPIGGIALIAGWLTLVVGLTRLMVSNP